MYEVEVKVPADHAAVRERLAELGAEPVDAVVQRDTYYDAPHREFAETDEALRVREETSAAGDAETATAEDDSEDTAGVTTTELTYKGPLVEAESKTRREVETAVGDGEATREVLDALGFDPAATVRKDRERFALDGFTVTLDSVDGLGEFVEVETEVDAEESVESAREAAFGILRDLGLDPDEQVRTSYLGLLLADEDAGGE
ncbi:class IV adenylate cyclase [Halorussus litoreus]|uniref:class IV adenylate cyclase n=1 Tax=Halorussus litoreus TaxID=1710536 RepID=UPI000E257093|nr:class IV adenylate cyclase [Halorussus litoreus]